MFRLLKIRSVIALGVLAFALQTVAVADVLAIRSGSGADAAAIQGTVDQFRTDLGNPNNGNVPGPLAGGRREINWDGAPGTNTAAPAGTPFNGFQNIRGASFTTPGTGFLQTPINAPEFTAINPTYSAVFETFSPLRIFTPLGSNILDVTFSIPGTNGATPALVAGFGSIFSDVDLANMTSLQFFNALNQSLGTYYAPTANNGLSFIGVLFDSAVVSRVRITNGNFALGPNDGGSIDVVVMDDFLYSEPQTAPVPEPATMLLLGTGLAGVAARARRRRKTKGDASA
ncbi:MAG: PEP-CTERM sorting domain-containing protein [Pyrinomonadaceae bacterium]